MPESEWFDDESLAPAPSTFDRSSTLREVLEL